MLPYASSCEGRLELRLPGHYHSALDRGGHPRPHNHPERFHVKRLICNAAAALYLLLALSGAGTAFADGDPERGRLLGYTCLGCHGIEGYRNAYPSYRVPKLGGQKPAYVEFALRAYRDETREHRTMQAQSAALTERDIEDIAAWLAGSGLASDDITAESVADLEVAQPCVACHGTAGVNLVPVPPVLSGQHQSYLEEALRQYREGERGTTVMSGFVAGLSDRDIEELAAFYAAQEGLHTVGEDE